jgi:hypothetical protein
MYINPIVYNPRLVRYVRQLVGIYHVYAHYLQIFSADSRRIELLQGGDHAGGRLPVLEVLRDGAVLQVEALET